jgi:hypothetical protein
MANEALVDWWNATGRALHESTVAAKEEKAAGSRRMVLLGLTRKIVFDVPEEFHGRIPEGLTIPKMTVKRLVPYATAMVTRETKQRLYVEDVEYLAADSKVFDGAGLYSPLKGFRPNEYVEHEDVMLDRTTRSKVDRLMAFEVEYAQSMQSIHADLVRDVLPIMNAFESRMLQKFAERDDMLRELMGKEDSE